MNHSVNISFTAATLHELEQAIALLKAAGVPCSASSTLSAVPTLAASCGPNEAALNATGKRIRFTEELKSKWQTREAYCAHLLRPDGPFGQTESAADGEKGETYEPGEIPAPEDSDTEGY